MAQILDLISQIHPAVWVAIVSALCLGYAFGRDVEFNSRLKRAKISDHLLLDRDIQNLLLEKRQYQEEIEQLQFKQREMSLEMVLDDDKQKFYDVGNGLQLDDSQMLDTVAIDINDPVLSRSSAIKGELV